MLFIYTNSSKKIKTKIKLNDKKLQLLVTEEETGKNITYDIEDTTIAISDELDEIEEDLDAIEDFIMDEDEDDDEYYDDDEDDEDDESWDDEDEEFEEGFDFGDEDSTIYEVECACGNIIDFDEETLEKGSIVCPNCGETLEFSVEDVEE